MKAETDPRDYGWHSPSQPNVYPLKENKRPIGFAPWPELEPESLPDQPKKKRKKKRR